MPPSPSRLLLVAAICCAGASAHAQQAPAPAPACDGLRVSRIDIQPDRPPFTGQASRWRHFARAVGLHHATTREGVVKAFLALAVGEPCTEVRRAETERVLRAQPFLADATVAATPDRAGGVVVSVRTVDEIPVLVNARFRGIAPRAFSLGNENVGGLGLLAEASIERGYAYRTGYGVRLTEYATFGRPYVASLDADRQNLGHRLAVQLEHPFYTDLQHIGWHVGYLTSNEYPGIRRPARDELALGVRQDRWEGSTISRVFGTSTVGLIGVAASGLKLTPQVRGIVVSDTGLATDTGTTLLNRYAPFKTTRAGVLGGIRRVRFRTVRGFDGLTAQQDLPNGAFAGLQVAKGLPSFGESDLFLSGVAYAGGGGAHVDYAGLGQVEGRRGTGLNYWDSVIGSGRGALYMGRGPGWVVIAEDQYSGGSRSLLPLQLALGDRQGGILGYRESSLAGAQRNVVRTELRWSGAALVRNADVGFATFSQVGTIWAGDAPYGQSATRTTVGISVLAAYPTGSKRLYRADLGIPLTRRGEGSGKIEVRFTSEDRTQLFWREPDDVSRARTGAVPTSLFAFPTR
ncbi:MAG TPA: hypothetical protein VFN38_16330 [Gemmatimonadaceae bacterium]|nr:hypothetical protein [Gemmatimonadaceae bacterium]